MDILGHTSQLDKKGFKARLQGFVTAVPLIGWFLGFLGAVLVEYSMGDLISYYLGLPKIPCLYQAQPATSSWFTDCPFSLLSSPCRNRQINWPDFLINGQLPLQRLYILDFFTEPCISGPT
jgi:hypothetical protein